MEEVFELAKQLQAGGHYEKAEECYRRFLEDNEDSFKALNNLGVVLECQDKLGEAVECFRKATQLVPEDAIPRYNLGHAFYRQERFESAADQFEIVLEAAPDHGPARMNLATINWRNGDMAAAETGFREAAKQADMAARALSKLGLMLFDLGRYEDARGCHLQAAATEESPEHFFHAGLCHKVLGEHEEAAKAFGESLRLDPVSRIAHEHRVRALMAADRPAEAGAALAAWAAALPGDPVCEHMRAAYNGSEDTIRCSAGYVRDTFGAFAGDFDETLERLGYQAPEIVADHVQTLLDDVNRFGRVLDAGCGTGLCGPRLRPHARILIGVDLAAPMLDRARQSAAYDDLVEADLMDYLRDEPEPFDMIVAADTFNYFGELEELFKAAAGALSAAGRLVFTLEQGAAVPKGYRLMQHGRFEHARDYIERSLAAAGFEAPNVDKIVLRNENGREVGGWLVSSRRR